MKTPTILLTHAAILAIYAVVAFASPDMFGAPDAVRTAINATAVVVIIVTAILFVRDLTR
jgi:hypothetical protein